jgi:hypothetical protein
MTWPIAVHGKATRRGCTSRPLVGGLVRLAVHLILTFFNIFLEDFPATYRQAYFAVRAY